MTSMRSDARRAIVARRERTAATPARIAGPIASTVAVAVALTAVLVLLGTPLLVIGAALVLVAAAAAVAAHRTTVSLAAGLTLAVVQPYRPGERVRLHSPEVGSVVDAEIVRIGLLNTTLASEHGILVVANSRMLRAA